MEDQPSFQFGVEIELLVGSRKKIHANWKSLAKDLSKRLQKAGIANHVNDSNDKSPDNYREWSVVQEVTIPSQPAKSLCTSSSFTSFSSNFTNHPQSASNSSPQSTQYTPTGARTLK